MQSVNAVGAERVLVVLTTLASEPSGLSLDELSIRVGSSKPTVHRAVTLLCRLGLALRLSRGRYLIGDEFLRLAYLHEGHRAPSDRIEPMLHDLALRFGETAHYASLSGSEVVYQAKVDPPEGAIRLSSSIGGRNPAYRTGVGKMLLSYRIENEAELRLWLNGQDLEAKTTNTIVGLTELMKELALARQNGYALDNQENELGVNCIALPLFVESVTVPTGALSVSALSFRTPIRSLVDSVQEIREIVAAHGFRTDFYPAPRPHPPSTS